jgi:hypothetical protein
MAGNFPPPDFPDPSEQDIVDADASFAPGPDAASICGFKFPPKLNFKFGLNLKLPKLPLPISFDFNFGLRCDFNNPFDVSAGVTAGGGRKALIDPDPDDLAIKEALAA